MLPVSETSQHYRYANHGRQQHEKHHPLSARKATYPLSEITCSLKPVVDVKCVLSIWYLCYVKYLGEGGNMSYPLLNLSKRLPHS